MWGSIPPEIAPHLLQVDETDEVIIGFISEFSFTPLGKPFSKDRLSIVVSAQKTSHQENRRLGFSTNTPCYFSLLRLDICFYVTTYNTLLNVYLLGNDVSSYDDDIIAAVNTYHRVYVECSIYIFS
ncbi:uncharacterized protein EV154DRAFT_488556 [Mucor mucedo]|uniref:uncharacterized protein n=1 Tax=Mucor mucedo TaxID=29922 RepID=UPI00221EBD40|nr:uncharacterized protein EV154DRAFT_488556 [Mucor mucedo]KAI7866384.1 hypothetical protein EV154DRAFT_488556 [Mucor mucedo]